MAIADQPLNVVIQPARGAEPGHVYINGTDLGWAVNAASVVFDGNGNPRVRLELLPSVNLEDLDLLASVEVLPTAPADAAEGADAMSFLEKMDAEELERLVLERMEFGGEQKTGAMFLLILKELAGGVHTGP